MPEFITDHLDLWTSALFTKSTAGRGSNGKLEAYGIKKLRELILELAVRGKLLPQDQNDEPASVLLGKIAKEKARLIKEGQLKQEKLLPDIGDDEKTFELPLGWEWVRFGTIAQHNSGKTLDSGRNTGQLRDYITTSNLYWGRFDLANVRQMPIAHEELSKCSARKGDLLICEGGEAGRAAVWPYNYEVCFQNHVHRARFYGEEIEPYFVYRFFEKLNATGEINQHRKGVGISNMSSKALALIVVPLPPHAEQQRIVAKVDELMALCDQLEQQQTDSLAAHQTVVETLLGTLTRVESQQEFSAAWARIANYFDTLFTTEASIDQLKQTFLQLAVMGKLVPQDPSDELGEEIFFAPRNADKTKQKWAEPIKEVEKPFQLPPSWMWLRLGDISSLKHGYAFSSEFFATEAAPFVLTTPGNFHEKGGFRDRESKRKYYSGPVDPEFILKPGDLIIPMTEQAAGLLGSPAFIPDNGLIYIHNQRLGKFNFSDAIAPEFAFWFFNCEFFRGELSRTCTGMKVRHTSPDRVLKVLFPVCPPAEQHRIVAKVNELMALCDALKACLADVQTTQRHLADAIVEQVLC